MPQNSRQQVTYGKSPLNRLQPYLLDVNVASRSSQSQINTPNDISCAQSPSAPAKSSPLPKQLSNSLSSQGEDGCSTLQRKRRKVVRDEAIRDHSRNQMIANAPATETVEDLLKCDNKNLLSKISGHDRDRDGGDTSRFPQLGDTPEVRPHNQVVSSRWRSARRQEPASRARDAVDTRSMDDHLETSQKSDSAFTRTRLVDSLRAPDERSRPLTLQSDGMLEFAQISPTGSASKSRMPTHPDSDGKSRSQGGQSTPIPSMLRSSKVTYSRQRSFLNDSFGLSSPEAQGMGSSFDIEPEKKSDGVIASHIASEDDEGGSNKPVRSIHELRQAGDNTRFREIVETIFEDIENIYNTASGRCCSLVDLCGKLMNTHFAHRFCEHGFDGRLVNSTLNSLDIVSASLALSAYKLIISGGQASQIFFESVWTRIADIPLSLLSTEEDLLVLARESSLGLSKSTHTMIRGIRPQLLSVLDLPSPCLSPCILALECAKSSLSNFRENGHTVRPMPSSLLEALIDLLVVKVPADLNFFSLPRDQLHLLELLFSIIENYTIISAPFDYEQSQYFKRLSQLHGLITTEAREQSRQVMISYIRVILNLTNKGPTLCDNFAIPELVSSLVRIFSTESREISSDLYVKGDSALNVVILALGALINLAEKAEQSISILVLSDDCTAPLLQELLEQFSSGVRSMDQVRRYRDSSYYILTLYRHIPCPKRM
ncbi:wings apart-like protein regulation of heterochromatin-domain-containing protein [Aspergillus californicus]